MYINKTLNIFKNLIEIKKKASLFNLTSIKYQ